MAAWTGHAGIMMALACMTNQLSAGRVSALLGGRLEVYGFNWGWAPYLGLTAGAEKVTSNNQWSTDRSSFSEFRWHYTEPHDFAVREQYV